MLMTLVSVRALTAGSPPRSAIPGAATVRSAWRWTLGVRDPPALAVVGRGRALARHGSPAPAARAPPRAGATVLICEVFVADKGTLRMSNLQTNRSGAGA